MASKDTLSGPSGKELPYSMAPLNLSKNEMRLVELRRNDESAIPTCILRSYPIDRPFPPYVALSYAWGEKLNYRGIDLNGVLFPLGRNVWTFLQDMRESGRYGTYWIDAISIDQNNVRERNHQVQMMRQIYGNAESVSIWLGEMDSEFDWYTAMAILEAGGRSQETFRTSKVDKAMLALCGRQYWTRTWIVQEILLAKEIFVYCGVAKVHWTTFADFFDIDNVMVSNTWGESSRISPVIESAAADIVRAKIDRNTKGSQPRPLMDLIKLCHKQQSTDIRDKIYALHGLASDTEDMVIDYDVPVEQLLVIVLKRTLASIPPTNNLDIENARIEILQTEETLRDALGIYHYIEEVDNIIYAEERRITSKCKTKAIKAIQADAQGSPHYLSWRHQILEGALSNRFLGPSPRSVKEGLDLFHSPTKSVEAWHGARKTTAQRRYRHLDM